MDSKTTFVTVNLSEDNLTKEEQSYSKTTFVTVNLSIINPSHFHLFIQKQHLLLLIQKAAAYQAGRIKFKNNICYC